MHEALRKNLDNTQTGQYLERIGLSKTPEKLTSEYLDKIIRAQLRSVPFDDADVWATGEAPSLETDRLFDKIITKRRGGYCFELNGLFNTFLRSLGFKCYEVIISLQKPDLEYEINPPAHCGVIVEIDGVKRFADVGYGGNVPDGSVPMTGETVLGYRMIPNGVYTIIAASQPDGSFQNVFTFKNVPCDPAEFVPLNVYVSKRTGSVFAADLKLNIRSDEGYCTVGARQFKYKNGDTVIEKYIETPKMAAELAREYFGIPDLPLREF